MTILDEINEVKREEIKKLKSEFSISRFTDSPFFSLPRFSLLDSLSKINRISIIAEIKKASPSKGIIKNNFNHLEIAETYMQNEVEAISILTDENFFKGSITYLNDIAMIKSVPLLRKDFIIDEYQIYEAKSNGADAILLITESLSKNQIIELTQAANENDLEVLLELHSIDQITKIDFSLNRIIGINNRDLNNFNVDLNTINIIGEHIPEENHLVAESGIKTVKDLELVKKSKAKSILIGEHLMASESISESVKILKEWCEIEN